MKENDKMLVATGKGLIVYQYDGKDWQFLRDYFIGLPVSNVLRDSRSGIWWAALDHKHWGQKLHRSVNEGKTWEEVPTPAYPQGTMIRPEQSAKMRYIWTIAQGGEDQPGRLYIGTEPGGLFQSDDNGESFQLVESLWNHPSRPDHWFGGGRNHAGIHSIVVDPRDSNHVYVGVSCAGVFETHDGGKSWKGSNQGLRADYLPDKFPEFGHDPHLLEICTANPQVIWQQNHCGVFRSVDAGANWQEITAQDQSNYYGFTIGIDHKNPERAWVIPALSDKIRVAVNQALFVSRTDDGGKTWQQFRQGLPQQACYDIVLRHALAIKGGHMAFGTNSGNLYVSADEGESWQLINHSLAKVFSVVFV